MKSAQFTGSAVLKHYVMYDLRFYLAIKKCLSECTVGELYFVNEENLSRLDEYEGKGILYDRKTVEVMSACGNESAFAYVFSGSIIAVPEQRLWKWDENTPVWYCCYGSNLNSERFRCYIEGGVCKAQTGKNMMDAETKDCGHRIR